ncbi:hypothetical protein [Mycobacterium sp.]|uniref:hypothetical protein n=1 Tax=Mycobacterium sp. TaxID=1785 RepID=UPI0025D5DE07|nr:hypothetical protein [Mycobacterium sp.]
MTDPTTNSTSYAATHARLTHRRGRARRQRCIDCGAPARHWSYDHQDPNELTSPAGLEYSLDLDHYEPRCQPCHQTFDARYRKSGIPRLHALAAELEPQIRAAVYERERARAHGDFVKMTHWDTELDRLTAPLQTARADRKLRA